MKGPGVGRGHFGGRGGVGGGGTLQIAADNFRKIKTNLGSRDLSPGKSRKKNQLSGEKARNWYHVIP